MPENLRLKELAQKADAWYSDTRTEYPELFYRLYDQLRDFSRQGNPYGFLFQLKDLFEIIPRWYVLTGIALAKETQNIEFVAKLCDPENPLSFGGWVSLGKTLSGGTAGGGSSLEKLLGTLSQLYEKNGIVAWRNDTMGHGALQPDTSPMFADELEQKLSALNICLSTLAEPAKNIVYSAGGSGEYICRIDGGPAFPLAPFIHNAGDDCRLFDSLRRGTDRTKELSYLTGKRTNARNPYLHELSVRYYGAVPPGIEGSFEESVFTAELEDALQRFHSTDPYIRQEHFFQWLEQCLQTHDKGVFLLQADPGTGKSVFTDKLDGYSGKALERRGFTCRAYHFSRMDFRSSSDFEPALQELFRGSPEDGRELRGMLPQLASPLPPEERGPAMAGFLREFQGQHKKHFRREKVLLVLDGIDQLLPQDTGLLYYVPDPSDLPEGVYLLLTCCITGLEGCCQHDFLECFSFTEKRAFRKEDENTDILKQFIAKSIKLSEKLLEQNQIERIVKVLDHRFTGLPVIRAVLANAEDFDQVMNAASLIKSYLALLKTYCGAGYFQKILSAVLTLALAVEPLDIRLLSYMAFGEAPTGELLAIIRDLIPCLSVGRDRSHTHYLLGHPDFAVQLRQEYPSECAELVREWQAEISSPLDLESMDYDSGTYIASGMSIWSADVLKTGILDMDLLDNMEIIAENFSLCRNSTPHIERISRILSSVQKGYLTLWQTRGELRAAARIIHSLAVSIPKALGLGARDQCLQMDHFSEQVIAGLPAEAFDDPVMAKELFFSYANRGTLMSQLGDVEKESLYHQRAWDLLEAHELDIPNIYQIPFVLNCAQDVLHSDPQSAVGICDHIVGYPESNPFQRARALVLKGEALDRLGQNTEAGKCMREAAKIVRDSASESYLDNTAQLHVLEHLGRHLYKIEYRFEEALDILQEALEELERRAKFNELSDRFTAARLLSDIGSAYCRMDVKRQERSHEQECLAHMWHSLEIFRFALGNGISFKHILAEEPYMNAAYAYSYYGMREDALKALEELHTMQQDNAYGKSVSEKCAELTRDIQSETVSYDKLLKM